MVDPLFELEQLTDEELKGFEIYRRKHIALYPPPPKPSAVKQGWEFRAYFIVSVAAVLLASMRTAEQFYRAATFSANPVLGYIEAFLAVFTVETGIVVYAAVLAARQKKISQWVMWVGIILLAAISIVAGLGQSLYLSSDIDPSILKYTEYMLSILIGPGASIAALIGGHILGQQIAMAAQLYEQLNAEYELEMEQYNEKVIRSWMRSIERKIVLGLVTMPKNPMHEYGNEALIPATIEPQIQIEEKFVDPQIEFASSVQNDGGNHRQPISQPKPQPMAVKVQNNAQIDPRHTRFVTQWLVTNSKTPFDIDLNPVKIAQDIKVDVSSVRNVLLKMRNSRPIREQ